MGVERKKGFKKININHNKRGINKLLVSLELGFLLFGLIFMLFLNQDNRLTGYVIDAIDSPDIDEKVYEILENNEEITVAVTLENDNVNAESLENELGLEEVQETNDEDVVIIKVSKEELKELGEHSDIDAVSYAPQIRAILSDSVPLINATAVWPLQLNSINITGQDETVCVIDSGIDFTHPDLIGKNKTCIIDCFEKNCIEDCSIGDDNGHGTHCAGIISANGVKKGVGIDINLIGLKVLDSSGDGSATNAEADLTNAINWCVENRDAYNISVISMSLGTLTLYSGACDSTFSSSWTKAINNATNYNISVVSATGNDASSTGINSPACIINSSAVGGTDDNDEFYVDTNKNALTDFFAPGVGIVSTWPGNNYATASGTSMATPHVAGAFALIRQFYRLQSNKDLNSDSIKLALNNTNVFKTVGSKLVPRIDVYSAIISLDENAPNVSLISPTDNTINSTTTQTFSCNATDLVQMKNLTLQVWDYSKNLEYNFTNSSSGTFIGLEKTITLTNGNYNWNCLAYDMNNNASYASSNFSLSIGNISVSLSSPSNNSFTNTNATNFTCLSQTASNFDLNNVTLYIWNSTGDLVNSSSQTISGTSNTTLIEYNFTGEGTYSWNCKTYNNVSESIFADLNNTITFDTITPEISDISSSVSTTTTTITWTTNENANSSVNYGEGVSLGSVSDSASLTTSHSEDLSGLTASTLYYYNVTSCDQARNCFTNGTNNFTTSAVADDGDSGSGGGGGGTSTSMTYVPSDEQIRTGYTKELNQNDQIRFNIIDNEIESHTIKPVLISSTYAVIEIRSDPFNITFNIGDEKRFDLIDNGFYDVKIKLNSITNSNVSLTVQTIKEEVVFIDEEKEPVQIEAKGNGEIGEIPEEAELASLFSLIKIPLGIFMGIIIMILIILYAKKGTKRGIEEHKEKFNKHVRPR